ncbi:tRNA lysidine(34) synthetase TilS [Desulfoluna sp.]|uniref:tRNA lysidine(34) synthetase TilS n=1 Tax=Desulfoluna sp. TaxID=2045199 RepID=UPI002625345D|nr:tRNA lysidine(34) synthetase TilS [Desulfoluna sp.]
MTRHPQTTLVHKVHATLRDHAMCAPGDHLLVALSGGADSMALLHSLHELAPRLGLTLSVAHLNHSIRGEAADRDQLFSSQAARALSLPYYTDTVNVPALAHNTQIGLEEAARQARHAFLHEVASSCGARRIAVGHHKGDMAEQLLLNLLRGSGLKGLGAMEPVTASGIIRPLITLSREEITAWLTARDLTHVTDQTNSDTTYTRNRVRHRLIPFMESAFNPSTVDTLARTAALLRDDEAWLQEMTETLYTDCLLCHEAPHLELSAPKLLTLHPAARNRVLRHSVATLCGSTRTLTTAHIENLSLLLKQGRAGRSIDLTRGLRGVLTRGSLHLQLETENLRKRRPALLAETPPFAYTIDRPTPTRPLNLTITETGDQLLFRCTRTPAALSLSRDVQRVFLAPEAAAFPITVRNTRPGDRFRPEGGQGSRKIGRFLADCQVEGPMRSQIPLVVSKEDILWVAGYRLDAAATAPPPGYPALEIVLQKYKKG